MKGYRGKAFGITHAQCSRVELVKQDEEGFTHLLRSAHGEALLLRTGRPVRGNFIHHSILLDAPIRFQCGDVVQLFPDGNVYLQYQENSNDNALFLTPRCNSRCRMCPQPPVDSPSLLPGLLDLVSLLEPSPTSIGITGGEPTVMWDDLLEVLQAIRCQHPDCAVQLLTNGRVLKDDTKARTLCGLLHPSSTVAVPLYSDQKTVHDALVGVPGAFGETMRGIRNLAHNGVAIEIRQVPMAPNVAHLPRWAEFLYRNVPFVAHVAIMGYEPIGRGRSSFDELWKAPLDYAQTLYETVQSLHRRDIPVSLFNYPLCHVMQPLHRLTVQSISDWKVRFRPACETCAARERCGGFFFSAVDIPRIPCHPM